MHRFPFILVLLLMPMLHLSAQVVFFSAEQMELHTSDISIKVVDKAQQPLPFASIYLIEKGGKDIAFFSLTDAEGKASIAEVPRNSFTLHVEYMGYKSYVKEYSFTKAKEDLGTIVLEDDNQALEAAYVSTIGHAIDMQGDTLVYNASSFRVSEGATLGELLKKMPGFEVSDNGDVKVNGVSVSRITVNGKTFFFGDKATALSSLPAEIVDKIKVTDSKSKDSEVTGIKDFNQTKEIDVSLKKEYAESLFGNISFNGGTNIGRTELMNPGQLPLHSLSSMLSAYSEKSQLTAVANAGNANEMNGIYVTTRGDGDEELDISDDGIINSRQVGTNVNMEGKGGTNFTAMASYSGGDKHRASNSQRSTFRDDGIVSTNTGSRSFTWNEGGKVGFELENNNKEHKLVYNIVPNFKFSKSGGKSTASAVNVHGEHEQHGSLSDVTTSGRNVEGSADIDLTLHGLGKDKRSVSWSSYLLKGASQGGRKEEGSMDGVSYARDYQTENTTGIINSSLEYTEPLSKSLLIRVSLDADIKNTSAVKHGSSDALSASTQNRYAAFVPQMLLQYRNNAHTVQGGVVNRRSRSTISSISGASQTANVSNSNYSEWAPYLRWRYTTEGTSLIASYRTNTSRPLAAKTLPVMDASNPAFVTIGNAYLQPTFNHTAYISFSGNNLKTDRNLNLFLSTNITQRPMVSASWLDAAGSRYSLPVNARRPSTRYSMYFDFVTPIDKERKLSLTLTFAPNYLSSVSYQNAGYSESLNYDAFDYSQFMQRFWGGERGETFYSGKSGFVESSTRMATLIEAAVLNYKGDKISLTGALSSTVGIQRYSVDSRANLTTSQTAVGMEATWTPLPKFEITSGINNTFFSGYMEGFNTPMHIWNFNISKTIKKATLSLKVKDILNSERHFNRTASEDFMEDVSSMVLGRHVMAGIRFNFGKTNAARSSSARSAAMNMAL